MDFFISKPINLIEVRQVIRNIRQQMENERDLHTIQSVFTLKQAPAVERQSRSDVQRKRIQYALSQLGMAGEKGAKDIMDMCMYLLDRHQQVCQVGVGALCAKLSDSPKSMEQRARRAVERQLEREGMAEELRLLYVAMTRAKKYLDLSFVEERFNKEAEASRFVREISPEIFEKERS